MHKKVEFQIISFRPVVLKLGSVVQ